MDNSIAAKLTVRVQSRSELLFEGEVFAVTAYNRRGVFDVLLEHANFISVIEQSLIIRPTRETKKEFKIKQGVLKVSNNHVNVYVVS